MTLQALQQDLARWLTGEAPAARDRLGETATPGLAVYLNTYRGQLMACLTASYPVLRAWLGETAFAAAAARHVDQQPPHSWTLDDYALDFPETLAAVYPADPEIGDLARLERALALAFVGPDAPALDLSGLDEIDWDRAVLQLAPTARIVRLRTNAAAIWSAIQEAHPPPAASALDDEDPVLVWRQGFIARLRVLNSEEDKALSEVRAGRTFADLCAGFAARHGADAGAARAAHFLAGWIADAVVVGVRA